MDNQCNSYIYKKERQNEETTNQNPSPGKEKEYKEYRNNLNKVIRVAKNGYYENKINENLTDMRKLYGIISEATNEKKKTEAQHNLKYVIMSSC